MDTAVRWSDGWHCPLSVSRLAREMPLALTVSNVVTAHAKGHVRNSPLPMSFSQGLWSTSAEADKKREGVS
jgi:hypothetical protein